MRPTLPPGRTVLVDPCAFDGAPPEPGDVVLLEHPDPGRKGLLVVKRVAEVTDGEAFVVGDDPDTSTDSRDYGPVPLSGLRGRVECTFP